VDELLDAVERRLAALAVEVDRLFAEEPVDVQVTAISMARDVRRSARALISLDGL